MAFGQEGARANKTTKYATDNATISGHTAESRGFGFADETDRASSARRSHVEF